MTGALLGGGIWIAGGIVFTSISSGTGQPSGSGLRHTGVALQRRYSA